MTVLEINPTAATGSGDLLASMRSLEVARQELQCAFLSKRCDTTVLGAGPEAHDAQQRLRRAAFDHAFELVTAAMAGHGAGSAPVEESLLRTARDVHGDARGLAVVMAAHSNAVRFIRDAASQMIEEAASSWPATREVLNRIDAGEDAFRIQLFAGWTAGSSSGLMSSRASELRILQRLLDGVGEQDRDLECELGERGLTWDTSVVVSCASASVGVEEAVRRGCAARSFRSRRTPTLTGIIGNVVAAVGVEVPDLGAASFPLGMSMAGPLRNVEGLWATACSMLQVATGFGLTGPQGPEQLGLRIAVATSPSLSDMFVQRYLAPLAALGEFGGVLDETLRMYFQLGCDRERASDALFVHPNTLRYRLRKISEILNVQLDDPAVVAEIVWALHATRQTVTS